MIESRRSPRKISPVLLISSPGIESRIHGRKGAMPSLALASIAAYLLPDREVYVLDPVAEGYDQEEDIPSTTEFRYGLSVEGIRQRVAEISPRIVGLSAMATCQHHEILKIARAVKEIDSRIVTVAGGNHASSCYGYLLQDDALDYCVLGEGERPFRDLVEALESGRPITTIPGLAYKEENRLLAANSGRQFLAPEQIPIPAYSLLDMPFYTQPDHSPYGEIDRLRVGYFMATRGCPYHCANCAKGAVWKNTFRKRPADQVIRELEVLRDRHGVEKLHALDDNLTQDREWVLDFLEVYRRRIGLPWEASSGLAIHRLDQTVLEAMRVSGCRSISLAVESGSQRVISRILRKPLSLEMVRPVIALARSLGLGIRTFFMVGIPGETKNEIRTTVEFAQSLDVDFVSFFVFTPLPGTALYDVCTERGYLVDPESFLRQRYYKGIIATPDFEPWFPELMRKEGWLRFRFFDRQGNLRQDRLQEARKQFAVADSAYGDRSEFIREWNEKLNGGKWCRIASEPS